MAGRFFLMVWQIMEEEELEAKKTKGAKIAKVLRFLHFLDYLLFLFPQIFIIHRSWCPNSVPISGQRFKIIDRFLYIEY